MDQNSLKMDFAIGEDGLPFSARYGDHYYSRHDGQAETAHVFLAGNDLPARWEGAARFTIGELGFGTGLNLLETWRQWREAREEGQVLIFHSLDAHPLKRSAAAEALARWESLADLTAELLENWDNLAEGVWLDAQTFLHVHHASVEEALCAFPGDVDAWFLDGFAPSRNPAMWSANVMALIAERSSSNATAASYTAAGWVRRNLAEAGFAVEKRPGFGTKRDMITARRAS
jgi:tRNA U34 5-methylaminomethyl-2-thiouridine-forming methyltransferase MnmC